MFKQCPLDYADYLIKKFEHEIGVDLEVDWLSIDLPALWGESAGFYINGAGERIIFVPRTRDKEVFKEFLFHECGHALYSKVELPKYLTDVLDKGEEPSSFRYFWKTNFGSCGERPVGMCSSYSAVSSEEEFAELVSFVYTNKNQKQWYRFSGERINLAAEGLLKRKVRLMKRFLKLA